MEKDIPPSSATRTGPASISSPASDIPSEQAARTNPSQSAQSATHGTGAGWQPHDAFSDPFARYCAAYGGSDYQPPDDQANRTGGPAEEGPVSPLHVTLIVMILLAGLAVGVGRWWWIDEKLETASAKSSALAALPPDSGTDEPRSSIQSSIDRAYIPPSLNSEIDAHAQDKMASLAVDPGPVNETKNSSAASPAKTEAAPAPKPVQAEPPKDPPTIMRDEAAITPPSAKPVTKPAASQPEQVSARPEKKRKSAKTTSSTKLASTNRKERLREIDRVRTQAFSETSKDRIGERKSGSSESPVAPQSERRNSFRTNKVSQHVVTRSQYARCERIDHIIRREKCKWALCNNQWGKGACPSFKHEKPLLF